MANHWLGMGGPVAELHRGFRVGTGQSRTTCLHCPEPEASSAVIMAAPQQSLATVCNGSRADAVTRESASDSIVDLHLGKHRGVEIWAAWEYWHCIEVSRPQIHSTGR